MLCYTVQTGVLMRAHSTSLDMPVYEGAVVLKATVSPTIVVVSREIVVKDDIAQSRARFLSIALCLGERGASNVPRRRVGDARRARSMSAFFFLRLDAITV